MQNELKINNIVSMEKLGSSAIGEAYKVEHSKYGTCVLKLFDNKNKKFIFRFLRDLEKVKKLKHPKLAKIYEISDPSEEHVYLIREWVPGIELQQILYEKQKLSLTKANSILLQTISGVDALHRQEVIHKNLKPNNLIVSGNDVKLVDFSLPPTLAQYLSPEQCKGKKSGMHSDIYAIGCMYFYMLSGRTLFVGSKSVEIMQAHVTQKIPDIKRYEPGLSKDIVDIFKKMVAKKTEHRPLNCHELFLLLKKATGSDIENTKGIIEGQSQLPTSKPIMSSPSESLETSTIQLVRVGNTWQSPEKSLETSTIQLVRVGNTWQSPEKETTEENVLPELKTLDLDNLPVLEETNLNLDNVFKSDSYSPELPNLQGFNNLTLEETNHQEENTQFQADFSSTIHNQMEATQANVEVAQTNTEAQKTTEGNKYLENLQNWLMEQNKQINETQELDESSILDMYQSGIIDIPTDDVLSSENNNNLSESSYENFVVPRSDSSFNTTNNSVNNSGFESVVIPKHNDSADHTNDAMNDDPGFESVVISAHDDSTDHTNDAMNDDPGFESVVISAHDDSTGNEMNEQTSPLYAEFQTTKQSPSSFNPAFPEKTINLSDLDTDDEEDMDEASMYLHPDDEEADEEISDEPAKTVSYQYPDLTGTNQGILAEKTINYKYPELINIQENKEIKENKEKTIHLQSPVQNEEDAGNENVSAIRNRVKNLDYSTQSINMYNTQNIQLSAAEEREFPYVDSITKKHIRKFKDVTNNMAKKLKVVNQTLALLDNPGENEDFLFLEEMLRFITRKTGEILKADYTIIFLYDKEQNELFSLEKDEDTPFDLKIPADTGIVGEVVSTDQVVNISYDFYEDPRCEDRKRIDEKKDYRTYTMLALPIHDNSGDLVAVVQLLNKLETYINEDSPLEERINKVGFTVEDIDMFYEFSQSMSLILESSSSFYRATKRQRAAASLISATQTLGQSLDLDRTLHKVMDEAKGLLDADRITLWLLDKEKKELWANIKTPQGIQEIRIPDNAGYAGKVAASKEPLIIPFDIYEREGSETSKETDKKTGYRTCSMMCIPVFDKDNELIGVTQAINKKRQGDYPPYNPQDWPAAPEIWKSSFNKSDMEFLSVFNAQAGVAIQNAALFDMIKRQEQMQRDILRSLSNGVISTDKYGKISAANNSAVKILGFEKELELYGLETSSIINIKDGHFKNWLDMALNAETNDEQYYPEQIIVNQKGEEHSINLSINPIIDVTNNNRVNGALVVIEDISHEKRMKNMMYRYMTQEVVEGLLSKGDIKLGGQLKHVTVLFSDIRSYTTLTEGLTAEEVVAMLNEYFEEMVDAIFKHSGTLDKYIGDAIMAVFGTPLQLENHGWCAVQTALEMRKRLRKFNQKRQSENKQTLSIGIGIHSDEVVSGNIGSSKRMEFTSIGDGVNLASRLEGVSKQYGCDIIISESTLNNCDGKVITRELDNIVVKGKTSSVKIYDLIGYVSDNIPEEILKAKNLYEKARELYLNGNFAEALDGFKEVMAIKDNDVASQLHIERCEHFITEPPKKWDGIWKLTSK